MQIINFIIDTLNENVSAALAICAFLLTIYQAYLSRKHNRLSVKPLLNTFSDFKYEGNYFIWYVTLSNCGLGPAIIKSYEVSAKSEVTPYGSSVTMLQEIEDIAEIVRNHFGVPNLEPGSSFTVYRKGAVLASNERKIIATTVLKIRDNDHLDEIHRKIPEFRLKIEFSSAYGESRLYDSDHHTTNRNFKSFLKFVAQISRKAFC